VRIRLNARPTAGLNVISEIPHGTLQRLEGRNGVGKTLAVRLLQLCTGQQPYLGRSTSWTSLKEHLGPADVTVDGLKDGKTLLFRLRPDGWPDAPEAPAEWLGDALLDGAPVAWADVPAVLRVSRIGGDETLGESLAGQIAEDTERVRQLTARQAPRRRAWDAGLDRVLRLTAVPALLDLDGLVAKDSAAQHRLDRAVAAAEAVEHQESTVRLAAELLARAGDIRLRQPALETELLALGETERGLRERVAALDRTAADLLNADKRSQAILDSMDQLARKHRMRRERRERRRRELALASEQAGFEVPVDLLAVQDLRSSLKAELDRLQKERLTRDRVGLVLEVLSDIERPVSRAAGRGLADEPVAQLPAGPLTAAELLSGVARRRIAIADVPTTESAALHRRISETTARLSATDELPRAVRLLNRAEADLAETDAELETALRAFTPNAAKNYQAVNDERATLLDALTAAVEDRASAERRLVELLAQGSADELDSRAGELVASAGGPARPDGGAVRGLVRAAAEAADAAKAKVVVRARVRDAAARELDDARTAVRAAVEELGRPDYAWLRQGRPDVPGPDDEPRTQAEGLAALNTAAQAVADRSLATINDLQSLERALVQLVGRLRASETAGNIDAGRPLALTRQVQRVYADRWSEAFSHPELREALFDGGTDVHFDLLDMTTSWTGPDGSTQTRPLEAFSSGERAFAYTRVKLEQLRTVDAANRIVFLDEFGAFVARDRLDLLLTYLRNQVVGPVADQVVLILPLQGKPDPKQAAELNQRRGYTVRETP
jgi:hypothetical protein